MLAWGSRRRRSVSRRSDQSWPSCTVQAPGTRTCTVTKARLPAWRVRRAWKSRPLAAVAGEDPVDGPAPRGQGNVH